MKKMWRTPMFWIFLIIGAALIWFGLSGDDGFERVDTSAALEQIAPAPVEAVAPDGKRTVAEHGQHLDLRVRPAAPVQLLLTGHMDTVYAADHPFQATVTRVRRDGAPHRAQRPGGRRVLVLPVAAPEARHVVQQRPHRADVGDVALKAGGQPALLRVDEGVPATLDEVQHLLPRHFLEVTHAAFAVNAALLVENHEVRERVVLVGVAAVEPEAARAVAVLEGAVLQLARAALVAGGAVQRVVDEHELQHALAVGAGDDVAEAGGAGLAERQALEISGLLDGGAVHRGLRGVGDLA